MSYIQPSSVIEFYRGVPFDSDYHNTGFFSNTSDQESYFNQFTPVILTAQSYQRVEYGFLKVELPYVTCFRFNYMRVRNPSYEAKWFYAFVTDVRYISDTVTAIYYELDVMQTWLANYTLEQCFIERQHSETDGIGDNVAPDPVDIGEPVYNDYHEVPLLYDIKRMYAMVCICDVNNAVVDGRNFQNIYSGADVYAFDPTVASELTDLNNFLAQYIQRPDAIVGMYMCPRILLPTRGGGSGTYGAYYINGAESSPGFDITLPAMSPTGNTLNGYAPKNNKLYTYPYNYLVVDNASGEGLNLRYEYFGRGLSSYLTPHLRLDGTSMQPVTLRIRPSNYKGSGFETVAGVTRPKPLSTEMVTINGYPLCSWNFDTYKAWVAQNMIPEIANMATSALGVGASLIAGGMDGGVSSGAAAGASVNVLSQITGFFNRRYRASIAADIFKGTLLSGNVNISNKNNTFYYGRLSCNSEYAKRIDDYFTMYGYAQGIVATPNRRARQRFTYVKTIGCEITANIPNDDQLKIKSIYDNGVRFWVDPSDIGNYSTANNVLT